MVNYALSMYIRPGVCTLYIAKNGHSLKWQILIKLILYKFEILRFLPDQHDLNSKSLINSSYVNAFEYLKVR